MSKTCLYILGGTILWYVHKHSPSFENLLVSGLLSGSPIITLAIQKYHSLVTVPGKGVFGSASVVTSE